ncbi:LacI family DNA-binding transcriptional regulator [Sanguibacter sp. YZGR15]|uniref:LacI family DNA-binding transcriptional regulator n=2 Tax=Sanguibacter suaedae TaxID=2795737 RepID=A0A934M8R6_9MICO|nr:LacI family DNA-binding transcriptional regulator [Sanguibacter suaedae]
MSRTEPPAPPAQPPAARRRAPSMADVAKIAGVSAQTVSRVANGRPNVDDATRDKVLSAMRVVGYQPNGAARALATGRFGAFGVISFSVSRIGDARTIEAIATASRAAGFSINLVTVERPTAGRVSAAIANLAGQNVDGLVIIQAEILDAPSLVIGPDLPVVVTDTYPSTHPDYPIVDTDQEGGVRRAVDHLLAMGHRTVWHVAGPQTSSAAHERTAAWRSALADAGVPTPVPLRGDWSAASGYQAGRELADLPREDLTAVFCANDQMALGLMRAFHERGVRIPEDVSVVGFDDIEEAEYVWPPLTTVRQRFDTIGSLCVQTLLDQMENGRGTHPMRVVPVELVLRSSSGPPGRPTT